MKYIFDRNTANGVAKLYESIGFAATDESVHAIQGKDIEFTDMVMTKEKFADLRIEVDE